MIFKLANVGCVDVWHFFLDSETFIVRSLYFFPEDKLSPECRTKPVSTWTSTSPGKTSSEKTEVFILHVLP